MKRIIKRYPRESDLQFEERVNLTLMCDLAHELISQRRFNNETAACYCIMDFYDYKSAFENLNIDKFFRVLEINASTRDKTVVLNISITCEWWKALYEAYSTVNEWVVDIDNNCIINMSDGSRLDIPCDCDLWQQNNDAYNQRIIDERLIRYIVAKDILARKSAK